MQAFTCVCESGVDFRRICGDLSSITSNLQTMRPRMGTMVFGTLVKTESMRMPWIQVLFPPHSVYYLPTMIDGKMLFNVMPPGFVALLPNGLTVKDLAEKISKMKQHKVEEEYVCMDDRPLIRDVERERVKELVESFQNKEENTTPTKVDERFEIGSRVWVSHRRGERLRRVARDRRVSYTGLGSSW